MGIHTLSDQGSATFFFGITEASAMVTSLGMCCMFGNKLMRGCCFFPPLQMLCYRKCQHALSLFVLSFVLMKKDLLLAKNVQEGAVCH